MTDERPRKTGPANLARRSRMCTLRSRPGRGEARTNTKTMRNTAPAAMPAPSALQPRNGAAMNVYSVIEIIGTSSTS